MSYAIAALCFLNLLLLGVVLARLLKAGNGGSATLSPELLARLETLKETGQASERALRDEMSRTRSEAAENARHLRDEIGGRLGEFQTGLQNSLQIIGDQQRQQLTSFQQQLAEFTRINTQNLVEVATRIETQLRESGNTATDSLRKQRQEVGESLSTFSRSLTESITGIAAGQKNQLDTFAQRIEALSKANEERFEQLRRTVDEKLQQLQGDNAKRLEEIRVTVDEKLQGALEKRLGDSFKQVSERLEAVHKGLGEMQSLATGVGDLKRVLTNVKTRGGWGEVQLGALLEELLSPDQFVRNHKVRENSGEVVEFAIKLPGRDDSGNSPVWLPIDSKFPLEDYQRLVDAQERADLEGVTEATKALRNRVKDCAKDIRDKYLNPPHTTDFGIMFLPTEGLYAEVVRLPGFIETLQRDYRVTISGPATFTAFLTSLQMGFQTLAIQKRSSEVWVLLSTVKQEFGRFGESLDAVKKKLEEATGKMDFVAQRARAVERKLRDVQELPSSQVAVQPPLLEPPADE